MWLLSFLLALLGFSLLCVNTGRNAQKIMMAAIEPAQQKLLVVSGWVTLMLSLWTMILTQADTAIGVINWIVLLTVSAGLIILTLSYKPRILFWVVKPLVNILD